MTLTSTYFNDRPQPVGQTQPVADTVTPDYWLSIAPPPKDSPKQRPAPSIADRFADLLQLLVERKRLGMIAWLSVGYYDGWRPSRDEFADLIAVELGVLTINDSIDRRHQRARGETVDDLMPAMVKRQQANSLQSGT